LTGSIKRLMTDIYKLHNQVKHYEWGSANLIPRLLGAAGDGSPWAELWMGSHSRSAGDVSLGELVAGDPRRYLGAQTAERYGELPFLFKLLAAEKPLSIQAHPNLAQAREGFERENRAHLALDAPNRNYRDSNHKPEIICAITPFTGMCGFRSPDEITRLLSVLCATASAREHLSPLLRALEMPDAALALRHFFDALFKLSPAAREALTQCVLAVEGDGEEWELARNFALQYPGDPAIIAPLYLSVFHLEPGEAVFIQAGVLHAYIHGFGVELMANSDNVLRGGLTSKHIDVPELMRVLDFIPTRPRIIKPETTSTCFTYPAPCEEFYLTVMRGKTGETVAFPRNAPAICIVTEGEVSIETEETVPGTILKRGESAFIAAGDTPLLLRGDYTLYAASVP